ncbi:MAG: hypothetical protein QM610_03095 [Chitinophagaceae bacterium]
MIQKYEIILETLVVFPINYTPYWHIRQPKLSNIEHTALAFSDRASPDARLPYLWRQLATTVIQDLNKTVFHRNINDLKINIA